MRLLALDIAEFRCGWACGDSGAKPEVGVLSLRGKTYDRVEDAIPKLAKWLDQWMDEIGLVAIEQYIPHGALRGRTSSDTRDAAILMNGAARAVAGLHGVPVRCPGVQTIRKHFCGDGRADKEMVLRQAKMLGYLPRDCSDYDMSDAVALWDFSVSFFCNKAAGFALT